MSVETIRDYYSLNLRNIINTGSLVVKGDPSNIFLEEFPNGNDGYILLSDSLASQGLTYSPFMVSNNVYYIDTLYGNNSTGSPNTPLKPYQTLTFVLSLPPPANSTIFLSGDFTDTSETYPLNLGTKRLICDYDCNFTNTSANPIFASSGFQILGNAKFILNGSIGGIVDYSGANGIIICDSITSTNSNIIKVSGVNRKLDITVNLGIYIDNTNNLINSLYAIDTGYFIIETPILNMIGINCVVIDSDSELTTINVLDSTYINNITGSVLSTVNVSGYCYFWNNSVTMSGDSPLIITTNNNLFTKYFYSNLYYIRSTNTSIKISLEDTFFETILMNYTDISGAGSNIVLDYNIILKAVKIFIPREGPNRSNFFLTTSATGVETNYIVDSMQGGNRSFFINNQGSKALLTTDIYDGRLNSSQNLEISGNSVAILNSTISGNISFISNRGRIVFTSYNNIINMNIKSNNMDITGIDFIGNTTGTKSYINLDINEFNLTPYFVNNIGMQVSVSEFSANINRCFYSNLNNTIAIDFINTPGVNPELSTIFINYFNSGSSTSIGFNNNSTSDLSLKINFLNLTDNLTLVNMVTFNNFSIDLGNVIDPGTILKTLASSFNNSSNSVRCQTISKRSTIISNFIFDIVTAPFNPNLSIFISNFIRSAYRILSLNGGIDNFVINKIISTSTTDRVFGISGNSSTCDFKINDINSTGNIFNIDGPQTMLINANRLFSNTGSIYRETGNTKTSNNIESVINCNYVGIRPVTGNIPINFLNGIINPCPKKIKGFFGIDTAGTITNYFNITNLIAGPANPPEIILDDVVISNSIAGSLTNSITVGNNQSVYVYGISGSTNAVGAGVTTAIGTYTINASFL